jgi:gas vesicle protein
MVDVSIPSRRPVLQHNKHYSSEVEVAHVRHGGKLQWIMCFGCLVAIGVALFYLNYQLQEQNRRTQMSLESIQNRQIDTEKSIADIQSEADTITDKVEETASQVSNLLSTSQKPNGAMPKTLEASFKKLLENSNDSFSPEVGLLIYLNFFEDIRRSTHKDKIRSWLKAYGKEKGEALRRSSSESKSSEGPSRSTLVNELEKWLEKSGGSDEDISEGLQKLHRFVLEHE